MIGWGVDYKTCCLLDWSYFKNYYKMIPIDISKQQDLVSDTKSKQIIIFTENLDEYRN